MLRTSVQAKLFAATSRLTDRFPRGGGRLCDSIFRSVIGSPALSTMFRLHNRRVLKSVRSFQRFLVIPDIHIGDTVMTQPPVTALRDFFPDAHIDYVVNKLAFPLVDGNPDASGLIPVYGGGSLPSPATIDALRSLVREGHYDLCLNSCCFLPTRELMGPDQPILDFFSRAPTIVRNESRPNGANHFIAQYYAFVHEALSDFFKPARNRPFKGVCVNLSDQGIQQASAFMSRTGLSRAIPTIMVNPDTACRYTMMPFADQADLLARLSALDVNILVGMGHTFERIGEKLVATLTSQQRARVRVVPSEMTLDAYASLVDLCDVFVTGDTGPMHVAAARRFARTGNHEFRNRTALLCLFGATTPRLSGYDSSQPGYLAANQDAPSGTYVADSPCRNITCLNKMFKSCQHVRCFENTDVRAIVQRVESYLPWTIRP
jgi:heptosyltransferase II